MSENAINGRNRLQIGALMTAETKRGKITCLISLFYGIAEMVSGFLIQQPFGGSIFILFVPIFSGLVSLIMGIHGARAANVPQKAAKLRIFALVMTLISAAAVGVSLYLGRGFTLIAGITAGSLVLYILIVLFSHFVQRALDRA
jgi:hypothetical protein